MSSDFSIQFSKDAYKYFAKLDRRKQMQLAKVLQVLQQNPFLVPNVKPLQGLAYDIYRLRVGDLFVVTLHLCSVYLFFSGNFRVHYH